MTKSNPRAATLSAAVSLETLRKMRIAAAHQDMSLSNYVFRILSIATRNFKQLNLNDIEQSIKKENEK